MERQPRSATLDFCPDYIIYNTGLIVWANSLKPLTTFIRGGYLAVKIFVYTERGRKSRIMLVHRLVAMAFHQNPDGLPIVNHKDGKKTNPHYTNLEWTTYSKNSQHAIDTGLLVVYTRSVLQYTSSEEFIKRWPSGAKAAKALDVHPSNISKACIKKGTSTCKGFRWRFETEFPVNPDYEDEIFKVSLSHPKYLASSYGRIYSNKTSRYMKTYLDADGYQRLSIDDVNRSVQFIIAEAFFGPPPPGMINPEVNHKNGDKADNRIENLEWVSHRDNMQHAHDTGLHPSGKRVIQYTLTGEIVARHKSASAGARAINKPGLASSVAKVCRREPQELTAGGFIWRYESDPLTQEEIDNYQSPQIPVVQFSLDGKAIKRWKTIADAARGTGVAQTTISQCAGNTVRKANMAGGFAWRADDGSGTKMTIEPVIDHKLKKVAQYELDGTLIKVWSSRKQAAAALGIKATNISAACSGKAHSSNGYLWKNA